MAVAWATKAMWQAPTPTTLRTAPSHRSPIPTATVICFRRSPSGCRAESKAMEIAELSELLLETSIRHGSFEAVAPAHDWWDWYAAYMHARKQGGGPDDAPTAADGYMADVKHIVVPPVSA